MRCQPLIGLLTLIAVGSGLLAGCATPYVVPANGAPVPPLLNDDAAIVDDGYRLPIRAWLPAKRPRAVLLAVHGLNDYSRAFEVLGQRLASAGIAVYAYDQRGFGATAGWGYWHGGERMARDLAYVSALLRRRHPELPFYLLGESMGGAVVLTAMQDHLLSADGVVLIAPAVWSRGDMPFYQRWALALMSHTFPSKRLTGEGLDLLPSDNLDMLRAWARDPLVIKATRVDVLYGVTDLMDRAIGAAAGLHGAVLLLYGNHDQIVPKLAMCHFLAALPEADPGLSLSTALYPDGYHMLTRDLGSARVLGDIETWVLHRTEFRSPGQIDACSVPLKPAGAAANGRAAGRSGSRDARARSDLNPPDTPGSEVVDRPGA